MNSSRISQGQVPLEFHGHLYIRQLLTLSLLSGRQVIIKNIRSDATNPGLLPYEINLLKLFEKVTNGTTSIINKTGTQLNFKPGIIDCNDGLLVEHECSLERGMTYWVEPICILGLFGKADQWIELSGNTDDEIDQGIDSFYRSFSYLSTQF
jgi:RNA 3'-terminal phosphate cyclase-like protein